MTRAFSKLPLDLSTFRILREQKYVYVDKTQYAYDIITGGRRFFLSRPRRFGKSLFVSTLKEILQGNRDLFDGLWIGLSDYAWDKYAVIALDFSKISISSTQEFKKRLIKDLIDGAESDNVTVEVTSEEPGSVMEDVVRALHKRYGKVAILIDEYDRPILHTLRNLEQARKFRDIIGDFFATVKGLDEYLDFVFLTGISTFAKASIFSGMNNLKNLTMQEPYAAVCGYTDVELDAHFSEYIQIWADQYRISYAELRHKIKDWYNGYRFSSSSVTVYSPFSIMHALDTRKLDNFWFESGTPTFLIEELRRQQQENPSGFEAVLHPEELQLTQGILGTFDVGLTPLASLLFQAGYLTIAGYDPDKNNYRLWYPNREVEQSLQIHMLSLMAKIDVTQTQKESFELRDALNKKNMEMMVAIIKRLFAHISYQIKPKMEREYHSLLQMAFAAAGLNTHSEYTTFHGRADIIVELEKCVYVIEVKVDEAPEVALAQIEERAYYERFVKKGRTIILLGLSFMIESSSLDIQYAVKTL